MKNPLETYISCARLVFSVEPTEPNELWDEFGEFEGKLREFYESLLCKNCAQVLTDPCYPKKNHFSCQHRVCLDCIGKNRTTATNCKMCSDFTLFEKSNQTKLIIKLFQELCELIKGSWIYDYIQRRTNYDTGQSNGPSLVDIIEYGVNYGRISIVVEDTSSDENSNSNSSSVAKQHSPQSVPYNSQTFPSLSPLPPASPNIPSQIVQSPEQFTILPVEPIQALPAIVSPSPPLNNAAVSQIVQYQAPLVQPQLPSTSKLSVSPSQPILKQSSFISHVPMRVTSQPMATSVTKSIMSPMKIQQQAPTIYSVMYTGSGNKITLKRKTTDETLTSDIKSPSNNINLLKTDNTSSNFKSPQIQQPPPTLQQPQTLSMPIVTPTSNQNTIVTPTISNQIQPTNPNEPAKRRGCRCGNATAAPGKLTCCGQRCPCYVDSKACIDCKCRGCRNPHYVDGHKKMRHAVPDLNTQQQQQQHFLASIQHQTAILKEAHKSGPQLIKKEEMSIVDSSAIIAKSQNSINNCIISMNSNGQYQIKPRIIMKEPVKTMSPLIFPTTSGSIGNPNNSSIQIVGLYSQVPMTNDKKIIIKSEASTTSVVSFTDTSKQHLLETSASTFTATNLTNSNML